MKSTSKSHAAISKVDYDAVIFDLDGVLTRTASVHAAAWKELFDTYLQSRADASEQAPFDIEADYRPYVDGKPRYDGVKSFLASRGIELPQGAPEDPPDRETICGLGNRKNEIFRRELKTRGAEVFVTSVAFVERLRNWGFRTAVASSSKNAAEVLEIAGIARLFDARIDGVDRQALDIAGKPDPGIFLEAAWRLDVAPARAVVIEDAVSGVEAGARGGFGLVLGVDRADQEAALERAGANVVVRDLSEVDIVAQIQELPRALDSLPSFRDRLEEGEMVVFLDYDGTLTPIVSRPELAELTEPMRDTIRELSQWCTVAVVSGRGLEDVRKRVGIDNVIYAGSHGFEIAGPGGLAGEHEEGRACLPELAKAEREIRTELDGRVPGAQIEPKRFSIAVHYRNVSDEDVARVEASVDRVLRGRPSLRKTYGKKVYEIQPDIDWDKGKALEWILSRLDLVSANAVTLYIGDDITDEDAFKAFEARGIGIVVGQGERPTKAHYRVDDPVETGQLLAALTELLKDRSAWLLTYREPEPAQEGLREALCTLGNGYFATRGAAPESQADDVHYPGTYLAGGYDRATTAIRGRTVENEDLVNQPNWLCLEVRLPGGDWLDLDDVELVSFRQELDLRGGLLFREIRFRDDQNRETRLLQRRLVSMADMHLAALETTITPLNWSGPLEIRSALDGRVTNSGVERYRELSGYHLEPVESSKVEPNVLLLKARTSQSKLAVAEASRTELFVNGRRCTSEPQVEQSAGFIAHNLQVEVAEGDRVTIEKAVSLFTSRDVAVSEIGSEAVHAVVRAGNFERLAEDHRLAWKHLWRRFDIDLELRHDHKGVEMHRILHLYAFHVLQTASLHSLDIDAGVPARGWHGEAYRGHIFWDEIVVFPFLNFRTPQITRGLLLYRYRRLGEARRAASELGYKGAMFPWQSGSNGREETQKLHLNPLSGRWLPDNTRLQRHVNAAIAYNVWQYFQVTGDLEFLSFYGAEMLVEIARFWASIATYNRKRERFEIRGIMGPDEYHDAYPGAERPGLDNNAYTNVMAVFVLSRALEVFDLLHEEECQRLCEKLNIQESEKRRWEQIRSKMLIPFHDDGIISQFEGYDRLDELDWESYRKRYGNIRRLDRILEAEGDTPNRYKLSKQADVLMLFYLFSSDELREMFERLGYSFEYETIPRNIDYYLKRTSNGSSLSSIIHAWVASRQDRKRSWDLLLEAAKTDADDTQDGTTREGIHLGAMSGVLDLMQRCYTGLETRGEVLRFNPSFPEVLRRLHFHLRYRNHWLELDIDSKRMRIESLACGAEPVDVEIKDTKFRLEEGMVREVEL